MHLRSRDYLRRGGGRVAVLLGILPEGKKKRSQAFLHEPERPYDPLHMLRGTTAGACHLPSFLTNGGLSVSSVGAAASSWRRLPRPVRRAREASSAPPPAVGKEHARAEQRAGTEPQRRQTSSPSCSRREFEARVWLPLAGASPLRTGLL